MSNVQTTADRHEHDLSRFVFSSGKIGHLKVLDTTLVQSGDSFDMDLTGVLRLSPLRRGLAVDSQVDIFSFYMPHRRSLGQTYVNMVKAGPAHPAIPAWTYGGVDSTEAMLACQCLGVHASLADSGNVYHLPHWTVNTYMAIWNNYFKNPYDSDRNFDSVLRDASERVDGLKCANLKSMWTAPLPPNFDNDVSVDVSDGSLSVLSMNQALGALHTEQQRDLFAQRYRDVVEMMGGSTHYDADGRPQLLMRSKFWASGYDVDGTDQASLGQFSGRVQQVFNHKVPRFYVPEHGCIMTVALVRFPPIHERNVNYLDGVSAFDYSMLMGDPAIDGNYGATDVTYAQMFPGQSNTAKFKVPWGQWHRSQVNHVDRRYRLLEGFPFIPDSVMPDAVNGYVYVKGDAYDRVFQTTQLGHWNIQCKTNASVLRTAATARDSVMTS